jgi:hypothetical protein
VVVAEEAVRLRRQVRLQQGRLIQEVYWPFPRVLLTPRFSPVVSATLRISLV